MDQLFLLDMQKDTVVNTIGSVMLDPPAVTIRAVRSTYHRCDRGAK